MRFISTKIYISAIACSWGTMTIFYGCGGGGSDARVSNLKEVFNGSPSQFGQVTRELNFSIKSKKGENTPNDLLRLNYFGFGGRETKCHGG
jgi:hypothetical protein